MTADLKEALGWIEESKRKGRPRSVGLVGNAAEIHPQLVRMGVIPDIVTDQTPAHDIWSYVPEGQLEAIEELRRNKPAEYRRRAYESIVKHVEAILEMQRRGAICFDYGNNLRQQAEIGGLRVRDEKGDFLYPCFLLAYIRPLFCEGRALAMGGPVRGPQRYPDSG